MILLSFCYEVAMAQDLSSSDTKPYMRLGLSPSFGHLEMLSLLVAVPRANLVEGGLNYLQLRWTELSGEAQPYSRTEHHRHSSMPGMSQSILHISSV